jgi:hypothetical protein
MTAQAPKVALRHSCASARPDGHSEASGGSGPPDRIMRAKNARTSASGSLGRSAVRPARSSFCRFLLVATIADFRSSFEPVVRDTLGELISEGFDTALRFGEPGLSGLVARKLPETRILTCAAPGYLARYVRRGICATWNGTNA